MSHFWSKQISFHFIFCLRCSNADIPKIALKVLTVNEEAYRNIHLQASPSSAVSSSSPRLASFSALSRELLSRIACQTLNSTALESYRKILASSFWLNYISLYHKGKKEQRFFLLLLKRKIKEYVPFATRYSLSLWTGFSSCIHLCISSTGRYALLSSEVEWWPTLQNNMIVRYLKANRFSELLFYYRLLL